MGTRRDIGLLVIGVVTGVIAVVLFSSFAAPQGTPESLNGTHIEISGAIERIDTDEGRLYVNTSRDDPVPVPLVITGATAPFECDTGGRLTVCEDTRSWGWVPEGVPTCIEATLRSDGVPVARNVFVNVTCSSALQESS